ncbi:MAG: hypothetical protein IPK85_08990 [Gemmatimonadetes bacterium]|nr:hypothetical protein [Gemmatimonadota bacterium]
MIQMNEAWSKAEVVAQILSAVGTLAAVVVALHLARQQGRARVRATATLGTLLSQGSLDGQEVLKVGVVNIGHRDAVVEAIGWRIGVVRRRHFFQTLSSHPLAGKLPWKLAPSERATFLFDWATYVLKSSDLQRALSAGAWRWPRVMRLTITLSTGEYLTFPVDPMLRNALRGASLPVQDAAQEPKLQGTNAEG